MQETPYVGRSKEIAEIVGILNETRDSHGSVIFVTGAVGIGKSRFLNVIENIAVAEGFLVMKGRGLDERSVPYLPFIETFKSAGIWGKTDEPGPIGLAVSAVQTNIEPVDANRERYRIFEEYYQKLKTLIKSSPVLIIIDDVQWADQSSLNLLVYLSKHTTTEKFSIICAYPDEPLVLKKARYFLEAREKIIASMPVRTMVLEPLTLEDTATLLESLLQTWKIPGELLKTVYEKTEGNPLFIEELAHVIISKGFYEPRTRKIKRELSELLVPENITSILKTRIDSLPENAKKALSAAAIFGRRFRYNELKAMLEVPDEQLLELLEILIEYGYIVECTEAEDTYRFAHNLFFEVSYEMLSGLRRKTLHEKAGKVLEALYRQVPEHYTDIAIQYWRACNYEKCAHYALLAARYTFEKFAVEACIEHAKRALECMNLLKNKHLQDALEAHWLLADAYTILGEYDGAIEHLLEIRRLAKEMGDVQHEIRAMTKQADVERMRGNPQESLRLLSEALDIARENKLTRESGTIYRMIGFVYEKRGDYLAAQSYYEKALGVIEKYDDEVELAELYHRYGTNMYMQGKIEDAKTYLLRAVEIRKKNNLLRELANTYNNLGALYASQNNTEKGIEYYMLSREIFEKTHDIAGQAFIYNNLGVIYHDAGNWERAMEFYKKDYETNLRLGNKWNYLVSASNIANLYKDMQDFERAKEYYFKVIQISNELNEKRILPKSLANLAIVYAMEQDFKNASEYMEKAMSIADETISAEVKSAVYLAKGKLCRMTKDYETARLFFNRCIEISRTINAEGDIATAHMEMGILEGELGNAERARELFGTALKVFEKSGSKKMIEQVKKEIEKLG